MNEFMVLVERAVRPVRAGVAYKLRVREELLSHLTAIFDEELSRTSDRNVAVQETIRRFGDPAQLTHGLQDCVPRHERINYYLDRLLGWRPPESAAKYTVRLAAQMFLVWGLAYCLIIAALLLLIGWDDNLLVAFQLPWIFLLICCGDLFILSLLYFKMRDALCGGLGVRRSLIRASWYGVLAAIIELGGSICFTAAAGLDPWAAERLYPSCAVAIALPIVLGFVARIYGPAQIRYTQWACLDISGPNAGNVSNLPA